MAGSQLRLSWRVIITQPGHSAGRFALLEHAVKAGWFWRAWECLGSLYISEGLNAYENQNSGLNGLPIFLKRLTAVETRQPWLHGLNAGVDLMGKP